MASAHIVDRSKYPQAKLVLGELLKGRSITHLEALKEFDCFLLAARIWDLRNAGYAIDSKMVPVNSGRTRIAKYSMTPEAIEQARQMLALEQSSLTPAQQA